MWNVEDEGKVATVVNAAKDIGQAMLDTNKEAAQVAAKIEMGNVGLDLVRRALEPNLPFLARGFLKHPLADAAIANAANLLIEIGFKMAGKDVDPRATVLVDAMTQAAFLNLSQSFNVVGFVGSLLDKVPGLEKAVAAQAK